MLGKARRGFAWYRERVIEALLLLAAVSSVLITGGIVDILVSDAFKFFTDNYNVTITSVPPERARRSRRGGSQGRNLPKEQAAAMLAAFPATAYPHLSGAEAEGLRK